MRSTDWVGEMRHVGIYLVEWCEEMGKAHVNSFMRYKRIERYVETSGDWEMACVRWIFDERGRKTEGG